ncbi:diuretic hormone receptor-like isoform X2 [Cimex lectularius]|uniref:Diuretic hormone receptor n=1 Tax=Cimex lectularius TaxID=79782 RepID=A0A8I6RXY3_CIMLE|nr:diuretic hormone receptor-like isoform X2 [Cimex lectularius]
MDLNLNLSDANFDFDAALLTDEERQCLTQLYMPTYDEPAENCPWSWDGALCWPSFPPGKNASLPCFEELKGIKYDTSQNASRYCFPNGTWSTYTNYNACQATVPENMVPEMPWVVGASTIYCIGYSISLVALCVAVWIFIYFKDLRCLRNTIHTNLMCTYILADFLWILNFALQILVPSDFICVVFVLLLKYFILTNYFWMFVEGLYLYMLVVATFTRENIKLRVYLGIGWGIPFLVMVKVTVSRLLSRDLASEELDRNSCSWLTPHWSDWIDQSAALLVLGVNLIFLFMIMLVLITKLRSSNNVETQQYRKASKALLVLIPLLGVTYIFFLVGPKTDIYEYIRAILLSTQGFSVALFYCFLNTEVQNTFRHHFLRWKESRDIGHRRYTYSKDWSPNTRTESISFTTFQAVLEARGGSVQEA